MERGVIRIVIVLVVAALGFGFKFLRRDNAGADFRKAAHRMVSRVEGYTAKPDYYDWLVDEGTTTASTTRTTWTTAAGAMTAGWMMASTLRTSSAG
jgi:hypothetical protein